MKVSVSENSQQKRLRTLRQQEQQNQQEISEKQQTEKRQLISNDQPIFLTNKNAIQSINNSDDVSKCASLLEILNKSESSLQKQIESVIQYIKNDDIPFNKGIQFYNCKNLIFLQYMTLLEFYKLFKINLVSFQEKEDNKNQIEDSQDLNKGPENIGHQLYKKLMFYNSLLLKLGPLEKKLDYQTTKMLRSVQVNNQSQKKVQVEVSTLSHKKNHEKSTKKLEVKKIVSQTVDALSHRARLDNLLPVQDQKDKAKTISNGKRPIKSTEQSGQSSSKKYVPPKLSAVLPKQEKSKIRDQRNQQRLKAHLTHRLMDDLKGFTQGNGSKNQRAVQQSTNDDLINSSSAGVKLPKRFIEKQRYQEQYWTRLPDTKQDKKLKKQLRKEMKRGNVNQLNQQLKQIQLMRNLVSKTMKKQ